VEKIDGDVVYRIEQRAADGAATVDPMTLTLLVDGTAPPRSGLRTLGGFGVEILGFVAIIWSLPIVILIIGSPIVLAARTMFEVMRSLFG